MIQINFIVAVCGFLIKFSKIMHAMSSESAGEVSTMRSSFLAKLLPGQMLESLFDAVPDVFYFVKDLEGRFMGASRRFVQMYGAGSVDALIGKTDYDFSPDFLADAFYVDDQHVMRTGTNSVYNKIELVPASDGSLDWRSTTKIPLYGVSGAVVGLAGITRGISDSDAVYANCPEMRRIVDYVRAHYRDKISVADMAREGGMSLSTQERLFCKTFGLTPLMYLRKTRLSAACAMLRGTSVGVRDIAVACGFNDQTNMTRSFKVELKITPLKYRRRFSCGSAVSSRSGL
jgi:AraC-like DNA-binding protein